MQDHYHYKTMARAIEFIHAHAQNHPDLATIAAAAGLSPLHFQRVFTEWTGVSPRTYIEYLTLERAKDRLAKRAPVARAALDAGLSGSSRLHDLMLKWEAVTPGEFAKKGAGTVFFYDWVDGPYGPMLLIATERGLAGLAFQGDAPRREDAEADMFARWPLGQFIHNPTHIAALADPLLDGSGVVPLRLYGTPFQIQVWRALLATDEGRFTTYSDIANAIDNPKAIRAVGTAVGRNPISWLIPCHRALRKTGDLGGYHWGLPTKRLMLARETARADAHETAA